jgi:ABC-type Fe3+-hydroxamate transport system substrate-binding protein
MAAPRRVVSLVPSVTETLFELGAGDSVVGITDYCIFPPALTLPRVGGTKNPRVEEIRALAPDLVHMNMEENLRRHGEAIETFTRVIVTEPKSVDDVESLIEQLGILHERRERAAELLATLRAERAALPKRAFTFACPIWKESAARSQRSTADRRLPTADSFMWCGGDTYVSRLVETAGGTNVLADRMRYPQVALDEVLSLGPDIVFLPDEPYVFTQADAEEISGARVIGPFPGHLFTWHGSRTIEGLRFLREALR